MQKKKIIITAAGLFLVLLCAVFIGSRCHTEWKKHALTGYMEGLKEHVETLEAVTVAVIDSGCSVEEAYADRISDKARSFAGTDGTDEYGHGSQMASLILANTPESVRIMPLKVMDGSGVAETADVAEALSYAYENGADVISLSLNAILSGEEDRLTFLINEITQAGVPVIVSAGNDRMNVKSLFPANVESAMVIGAANGDYAACDFSNYGDTVDFCAYGKFNGEWGTSFAAAYVVSLVAELKAYGKEDAEEIFRKYAASYEKSGDCGCGQGYLWVDYAKTETAEIMETTGTLYLGGTTKTEKNIGADLCSLDWENMDGEELTAYLGETDSEYVGMFLCSLTEEEFSRLKDKCTILDSIITSLTVTYDRETGEYVTQKKEAHPFTDYAINACLRKKGRMAVSAWIIQHGNGCGAVTFYVSNTPQTGRYKFEIFGMQGKEASNVNGNAVMAEELTINRTELVSSDKNKFKPAIVKKETEDGRTDNSISLYLTDVTVRHIAWVYEEALNRDEVKLIRSQSLLSPWNDVTIEPRDIYYRQENAAHNRLNGADNGNAFYGVSIKFDGVGSPQTGYYYAPASTAYRYEAAGSTQPAYSHDYTELTDAGFIFHESPKTRNPIANNFNSLTSPMNAVLFKGQKQESYTDYPDPIGGCSMYQASRHYDLFVISNIRRITDRLSYLEEAGTFTLNSHLYQMSSTVHYAGDTGKIAIENDVAEYIFHLEPNEYTVTADADGGTVTDYPNDRGRQVTASFPVKYGCVDYDNIGGLAPRKDGYVFGGWYTEKNGKGVQVWDKDGLAKRNGICWSSSGRWKHPGSLTVYAYWIPSSYVQLDANWGTITDYIGGAGSINITGFFTEYGQDYYDDIGRLYPVRDGFVFQGWYVDPEDPDNSEGKDVGRNGGVMVWGADGKAVGGTGFWSNGTWSYDGGNVVAFAHWSRSTYNVKFDANGGAGSKPAMSALKYGQTYPLSVNTPPFNGFARTGYSFTGWNTMADGKGKTIDDGESFSNLTKTNDATVTLYAQWRDTTPPSVKNETESEPEPSSTSDGIIYDWTNQKILLKFTAADNGSGMKSLILYEGYGTTGTVLQNRTDDVQYLVSKEGIQKYTVVATDYSGNTETLYITTRIDHVTPKGDFSLDYDGYKLTVSVDNIIEECTGNKASGCREAWIDIKGLDGSGNILYEDKLPLILMTPENIYTGASYEGEFELSDGFNYEADFIRVNAFVKDNAGNYLPAVGEETVPAFTVKGYVERCLGPASRWSCGESGNVHIYAASYADSVSIEYPAAWITLDDTLERRIYDYMGNQIKERNETDLFSIPLYAENREYSIIVHAFKNGREKTVTLPVVTDGSVLEEIRTRLR